MSVKLTYLLDGGHTIAVEVPDVKACFAAVSHCQEVFSPDACGHCDAKFGTGKATVRYKHRTTKENHKFYELVCSKCGWEMGLGQKKEGGALFPRGEWKEPYQGGSYDKPPNPEPDNSDLPF